MILCTSERDRAARVDSRNGHLGLLYPRDPIMTTEEVDPWPEAHRLSIDSLCNTNPGAIKEDRSVAALGDRSAGCVEATTVFIVSATILCREHIDRVEILAELTAIPCSPVSVAEAGETSIATLAEIAARFAERFYAKGCRVRIPEREAVIPASTAVRQGLIASSLIAEIFINLSITVIILIVTEILWCTFDLLRVTTRSALLILCADQDPATAAETLTKLTRCAESIPELIHDPVTVIIKTIAALLCGFALNDGARDREFIVTANCYTASETDSLTHLTSAGQVRKCLINLPVTVIIDSITALGG